MRDVSGVLVGSTSAALAAALLASSAAVVLSLPPRVLPGVLAVRLRGGGTDEGCELLPSTRPGCAKGSASFADFEHRLPIAVGQGNSTSIYGLYLNKFRYRPKSWGDILRLAFRKVPGRGLTRTSLDAEISH